MPRALTLLIRRFFSYNFSVIKICGSEKDDCHQFATCADTGPGTHECICNEWYTGDGKICKGV